MIFSSHMKTELEKYIKQLAASSHDLSKEKCRTLILEYAVRNGIEIPEKWQVTKKQEWGPG